MVKPSPYRISSPPREAEMSADDVEACCPSCRNRARFRLIGEQRWSPLVAQRAGLPEVIRLYLCSVCSSTISENNLLP
jgi:hypothetical protein